MDSLTNWDKDAGTNDLDTDLEKLGGDTSIKG